MKFMDLKKRASRKLKIEQVQITDEEFICIKELTAKDRDLIDQKSIIVTKSKDASGNEAKELDVDAIKFTRYAVLHSLCDEEGKPLVNDKNESTVMDYFTYAEFNTIRDRVFALNNLGKEDKAVVEAAKNSETDQPGDSALS